MENKSKKITNVPNLRFPEFNEPWGFQKLSQVCRKLEYGIGASAVGFDGKHRYIRITDISNWGNNETTSPSFLDQSAILKDKDILLARTGATVGDSFIYKDDGVESYFAGFLIRAKIEKHNPYFIYYQLKTNRYFQWVKISSARSGQPGINSEQYGSYKLSTTSTDEENKIASFLTKIDERIDTQIKIIRDLNSLFNYVIDKAFSKTPNTAIGNLIKEESRRNKKGIDYPVFSVNNKKGFIPQKQQFEDKEVASANRTNYKIVQKYQFAYNPARINVGSIGLYKNDDPCVVSPMYNVFSANSVNPVLLDYYFKSKSFFQAINKRLEGSVRMCLTIDGLKNIKLYLPDHIFSSILINFLNSLSKKLNNETLFLDKLLTEKKYLLENLFI